MKSIRLPTAGLVLLLLLPNPGQARQDGKGDRDPAPVPRSDDEPEFAITPNTIRIQPTNKPEDGRWVLMPRFSELGSPCFSRDGEWIAFDAYKAGRNSSPAECWFARADGRELRRLTFGATPRWSPDGRRLVFMRNATDNTARRPGIYVIDRNGTDERRIGDGRWPDWSPDGKEIVFSLGGRRNAGAWDGATICVARNDGTERRSIIEGDCPSWSPDGKKIAYCRRTPGRRPLIYVRDLTTGRDQLLGTGWYRANWMPDSKTLVANGVIGDKVGMIRLSLDAPERVEELATEFERPSSPCCSWDGKQVIFIARRPVR